ncbi:DUF6185 family protein [Streptomyces sp. NPDC051642]|uniref:DUF6185 family protein n=1 Tax=Streptomyces sp. NPDC051642 TaxID=3154646 RepID=UPI003432D539
MSVIPALVAVLCVLVPAAPARAAGSTGDGCASAGLSGARVSTSVELQQDDQTYTKISTKAVIDVPAGWRRAGDLLLSEDSRAYITAMACLIRHKEVAGQQRRWPEWRPGPPTVTSKSGRVTVVYRAYSWVGQYRSYIDVGLWQVRAGARVWTVRLAPPPALAGAHWDTVSVDPGAPGAESAKPRPAAGKGGSDLVWRPDAGKRRSVPAVTVTLRPSWQRSWAAQSDRLSVAGIDVFGGLLWTVTAAGVLLVAARRYRRRSGTPTDVQRRTLRNLTWWSLAGVALYVLAHTGDLVRRYLERRSIDGAWLDQQIVREHALALAVVALLFCFARPSKWFWAAAAPLIVLPVLTMTVPRWFGLRPSGWSAVYEPSDIGLAAQATASGCLMVLTVLGFVAVAWRLAVDGGLLPKSRSSPPQDRILLLRVAGPSALLWTVFVAVCFALVEESNWQRASWLSHTWNSVYGIDHQVDFVWSAVNAVGDGQQLILDYSWFSTGLAILAVLRTWRITPPAAPEPWPGPLLADPAERLLFLAFFPIAVGTGGGAYLDNALVVVLWLPLYMLSLYGAVKLLARNAVLAQPFETSRRPLADDAGPGARTALLEKSRTYREIHAKLRRLDQGLFGDDEPVRAQLERDLDKLHDWPGNSALAPVTDRLPANVSVVDATLALGPRDDWWANGVRGARLALIPGLPAAALGTWADWVRGGAWQDTLSNQFGLPGMALAPVYWLTTWVGAGFLLGALWRVLPGRRGAVKALPIVFAFALPVGLDVLTGWFTDEGAANLALFLATLLLVLTITGIALDLDTFQGERRYWQSRLGLLLSVYQMRYYSLQFAYLIGQVIAVISIWQFFAEPSQSPPDSTSQP